MNRIYFFTGTGNSLNAAKIIAGYLPNCELVAICKDTPFEIPSGYDRIGFVFPNYVCGPPKMVELFVKNMKLPSQGNTYMFAVATSGASTGSAVEQFGYLIEQSLWKLNYAENVVSFSNGVTAYPLDFGIGLFTKLSDRIVKRIAGEIKDKKLNSIPKPDDLKRKRHENFLAKIANTDQNFYVTDSCSSCGTCTKVCPAKNITIQAGKPVFLHQCESCMSCMQRCAQSAIKHKDTLKKRNPYVHPNVRTSELVNFYKI